MTRQSLLSVVPMKSAMVATGISRAKVMITCSKKKGETAAGTRPRYCNPSQAMLRTPDARDPGRDQAVVLEKVEMPPSVFFEIMSLAKCTALRTRVKRSSFSLDIKTQLTRRLLKVQRLTNDFPGGGQSKAQCQQIICVHKLRLDQILM